MKFVKDEIQQCLMSVDVVQENYVDLQIFNQSYSVHIIDSKIFRSVAIILGIFSLILSPIFNIIMFVINRIKPKDHDWQIFIS